MRFIPPVLFILLFLITGTARGGCEKTIRIAAPASFAPYIVQESDGRFSGLEFRLTNLLMTRMGCRHRFIAMPWKRGLLQLENGQIDIVLMASWRKERTAFARYSLPYRWEAQQVAVRRDLPGRSGITNLQTLRESGLSVGSLRGAYHGEQFQALFEQGPGKAQYRPLTEPEQVISQLMLDRVGSVVMDANLVDHLARRANRRDDVVLLDFIVYRNKVHFLISKAMAPTIVRPLNEVITALVGDPIYSDLYPAANRLEPADLILPDDRQ